MKKFFFVGSFLITGSLFAQKTFTLTDSVYAYGQIFRTYSVKFELDRGVIKTDSYSHLDSIANFLLKNKTLTLEVQNHCDSRYSDKISTCLTCARADAIVEYLIQKGIAKERLIPKGFNDHKLLIPNSQIKKVKTKNEKEALHALNRRTEYKITGTDFK